MATMLRLYEAVDQYEVVLAWMDEHEDQIRASGGELPPELHELLEQVEGTLTEKLERTALVVRNLSAMAAAAEEESNRLANIAKTYAAQAESLKRYIYESMQRAGIAKVEGIRAKLWIQANGQPSVRPANPDEIPEEFKRVKIEFDARKAMDYLKANNAIPKPEDGEVEMGGLVVSRGTHLRIK